MDRDRRPSPSRASSAASVAAAARLRRQPGARRPEHPRCADRVEVELVDRDRHVRRRRLAVEEQREVVGRVDLAEDDRRAQRRVRADPARIDAEPLERAAHVRAERVVADLRDDRARARPGALQRRRRSSRSPPRNLANVVTSRQPDVELLRVEVDADAPHRDQVVRQWLSIWARSRPSIVSRSGSSTPSAAAVAAASRRVSNGAPPGGSASASGGPVSQQLLVELERLDRLASEPHAVGVLAAAAVQDAAGVTLERAPDQLARVGGERRRRARVQPRVVPDREAPPGAQRIDQRRDEVAEARVLRARRLRPRPVHALHAGDPRHGAALRALGHDQLGRRLEEAVGVDRVGRLVLGGGPLRSVEHPVGRDRARSARRRIRCVDEVARGLDVGPPRPSRGRSAVRRRRSRSPRARSRRARLPRRSGARAHRR